MKKRGLIAAVLTVVFAGAALSGCGQDGAKKGKINTAYYMNGEVWPDIWKEINGYFDETVPREATVTVNGNHYTGIYSKTVRGGLSTPDTRHYYNGDGFHFSLRDGNGKCDYFDQDALKTELCTFDAKEGRKRADAFAEDYLSLQEYEVTEGVNTFTHTHSYTYIRYIEDIATSDQFTVRLNCDGSFEGFICMDLGAFQNVKHVEIDEEKIKAAINKLAKNNCEEIGREFSRCEIGKPLYLVKTAANQCALLYVVGHYYKTATGEEMHSGRFEVLVIVDYEKYDWFKP